MYNNLIREQNPINGNYITLINIMIQFLESTECELEQPKFRENIKNFKNS